jgi:hypothetical protein
MIVILVERRHYPTLNIPRDVEFPILLSIRIRHPVVALHQHRHAVAGMIPASTRRQFDDLHVDSLPMHGELLRGAQYTQGNGCPKWKERWVPFNIGDSHCFLAAAYQNGLYQKRPCTRPDMQWSVTANVKTRLGVP